MASSDRKVQIWHYPKKKKKKKKSSEKLPFQYTARCNNNKFCPYSHLALACSFITEEVHLKPVCVDSENDKMLKVPPVQAPLHQMMV